MNNSSQKENTFFNNINIERKEITFKSRSTELERALLTQQKVNEKSKELVRFSSAIITQYGRPIYHPNTINAIQGKSGVHKSRLAEHIASTLLMKKGTEIILGFERNIENVAVVYIDTERNLDDQLPHVIQSIRKNAGFPFNHEIPNFEFLSLMEIQREKRIDVVREYLQDMTKKFDGMHLVIFLDVTTDFMRDFNDQRESMLLIDILNQMINTFQVTIICVIHENPGNNTLDAKARGHIGTELSNKGTTNISLNYADDSLKLIKVNFIKCRKSERYPSFYVKYDKNQDRLMIANDGEIMDLGSGKVPISALVNYLIEVLSEKPMERSMLIEKIKIKFQCKDSLAIAKLREVYSDKLLIEYNYDLIKENIPGNDRNRMQYRIQEIDTDSLLGL